MNDTDQQSHTHNFDALIGTWKVLNRRKKGDYFSPDQALGEEAENTFPQLPVREGEHVFVWFASFADDEAYAAYQKALAESSAWIISLVPALQRWLSRPEEVLELVPTRRSLVRHRPA